MSGLTYRSPRLLSVRPPSDDLRYIDGLRYQDARRRRKQSIDVAVLRHVMGASFPRFGRIAEPSSDPSVAPPRWPTVDVSAQGLASDLGEALGFGDLDKDFDHAFGGLQLRVSHPNLSCVSQPGEDAESAGRETAPPATRPEDGQ